MAIEMIIPIEDMADPMPIDFTFKCTNTDDITIYVKSELDSPPAGWNTIGAELHGALVIPADDYFLNDNNTRDKPANLTEETVNLKISYYSDAGYSVLITSETFEYTITYVDFTDVGFTVVDDDGFEVDLEGWTKVDEIGASVLARLVTGTSRTGAACMYHSALSSGEVAYATKSFTIGNVTRAFIRIWHYHFGDVNDEWILDIITDAGGGSERILRVAMDGTPKGGTEIMQQWICSGMKLPVNGAYEVRFRVRAESTTLRGILYDDIRVVQS